MKGLEKAVLKCLALGHVGGDAAGADHFSVSKYRMGRGAQPANGAALREHAPVSGAFRTTQHLIFSYRAGCEILRMEMLQHVVAQHFFWLVAEHLLHRRAEISEAA